MDTRTTNLLQALDGIALEILVALLESPSPEKTLVERVDGATQSAVHKKLRRLEAVGLIRCPPTAKRRRGQAWSVVLPQPTTNLLKAVLLMATELDAVEQKARQSMLNRLGAFEGPGLRIVENSGGA